MGRNSIISNLSKEDIIAEIRLTLAADLEHQKSVVIVEGEDDIQFFNGRFHEDVEIRESFSGKIGVNEIVECFNDSRVIGICDRDYDLLSTCNQMFYYDYSCLEMMLVASDSAFSPVVYTFYRGKLRPQEIRLTLLRNLKWLSLYRKLNTENKWAIRFSGISIATAYDPKTQTIDLSSLLRQISDINPGLISHNREQLVLLTDACRNEYDAHELLMITQGHDFFSFLQTFFESERGYRGRTPNTRELFHSMVCAYHVEDFEKSVLHKKLVLHQNACGIKLFP